MRKLSFQHFGLILLVLANLTSCSAQDEVVCHSDGTFTCGPDDLNHSILMECDSTVCRGRKTVFLTDSVDWNTQRGEIIHVKSSRAGARMEVSWRLPRLDYTEDDETRMLDINTTLYIDTSRGPNNGQPRKLIGFGATINFFDLDPAWDEEKLYRLFDGILGALLTDDLHGAHFSLIRLLIHPVKDTTIDLFTVLLRLDSWLGSMSYNYPYSFHKKVKIVIDVHDSVPYRLEVKPGKLSPPLHMIGLLALADETGTFFKDIRRNLTGALLFRSVDLDDAYDFLEDTTNISSLKNTQGLLVRSKPSIPYEVLRNIRNKVGPEMPILTVGRGFPKSQSIGDWQSAQASSVELSNLLLHGSDGYIEERTIAYVLQDARIDSEASIYSMEPFHHSIHLRGPKFYTTAHFSRYLHPGSRQLKTELFTQPNMYAAHYSAFMSPDSVHVICVVSNENEHLLPLRLAINRRIRTMVNLEPKSVNTFVINVS